MDIRCAPCEVCGSASSGFHFGVLACEGCKGFYRRAVKFNLAESYKCLTGLNECEVSIKSRKCQKCRYNKCVVAGMAPEASRTGRPTKVRQAEIRLQLEQLRTENRLLPTPNTLPPHLVQQQREKEIRQANKIAKKAARRSKGGIIAVDDHKPSTSGTASTMDDMDTATSPAGSAFLTVTSPMPPSNAPSSALNESAATDLSIGTPHSVHEPALARQVMDSFSSGPSSSSVNNNNNNNNPFERAGSSTSQEANNNNNNFESVKFPFGLNLNHLTSSPIQLNPTAFSRPVVAMADSSTVGIDPESPFSLHQQLILQQAKVVQEAEEKQKRQQEQQQKAAALSSSSEQLSPSSQHLSGALATILLSSPDASGLREFVTPARDLTSLGLDQLTKIVRDDARSANSMFWLYNSGREWFNNDLAALFGCPPLEDPYQIYRRYVLPMQPSPVSLSVPLSEPSPMSFLPSLVSARTEWLIQRVVKSAAYLSKIQSTRTILTERNLELTDVWRRLLSGFELNAVHMINFIKSLPGFTHIDLHDRILLTTHAMMPLLYAQLSLDFDPNTETVNFFSMSRETAELVLSTYAGPDKLLYLDTFRRHFVDAGYAIKSSSLTVVEFGLLCALIFFNTAVPGLKDPTKVETVRLELSHAAEAFVYGNFPNEPLSNNEPGPSSPPAPLPDASPLTAALGGGGASASNWPPISMNMTNASNRIANFRSLVSYFRNLNLFASWLRGLTMQVHPYLVECSGQVFREMHTQMEHTIKTHALHEEQAKLTRLSTDYDSLPSSSGGAGSSQPPQLFSGPSSSQTPSVFRTIPHSFTSPSATDRPPWYSGD